MACTQDWKRRRGGRGGGVQRKLENLLSFGKEWEDGFHEIR